MNDSNYITGKYFENRQKDCVKGIMNFYTQEDGNQEFLNNILKAKKEIRIDIPNKPVESSFCITLAKTLNTIRKKGIKVCIRAEDRKSLPKDLIPLAIEKKFVNNPLAIIDKKIVWYGIPISKAEFKDQKIKYHPIFQFKGKNTASALYGFMEMNKTIDDSNIRYDILSENAKEDTFAAYVKTHKKCPTCGKQMQLKKSKKGKFFLACMGYPKCKTTAFVEADFVEEYFNRNGGTGQKCLRCKYSLKAEKGIYGVYIHCCGQPVHKYKLDEI